MDLALLGIAFLMAWAGATLLLSAYVERRRRPTLSERLSPYQYLIADEAHEWLQKQQ